MVYKRWQPTMTYEAECWAVRKKDENRLHVAEMRMLRWIRGKTRKDHVRKRMPTYAECQHYLDIKDYIGMDTSGEEKKTASQEKMMDMVVPGQRRRERPTRRWSTTSGKIRENEMTADMTENRQYWQLMAETGPQRCGDGIVKVRKVTCTCRLNEERFWFYAVAYTGWEVWERSADRLDGHLYEAEPRVHH